MYYPRIYDLKIKQRLASKGAILVEGPKWCGKTTTCRELSASVLYLSDPATKDQNLSLSQLNPQVLLSGETPRLIDEWQLAPSLWDSVRFEVDQRGMFGQFLLTGSSVPADLSQVSHSGTGRIARIRMRTMSLFESKESSGLVSLRGLFDGEFLPQPADGSLESVAYAACRGGWPTAVINSEDRVIALQQAFDYLDAVAHADISASDGVSRNPDLVFLILRALARASGAAVPNTRLLSDLSSRFDSVSINTLGSYLNALSSIFVTEDLENWSPNLRSKATIRATPVRHFTDPSIAAAALGATPENLLLDLNTFGLLFESLCVRDLRIYAELFDGQVRHYRDSNGLEADAVVTRRDGSYGLVEMKLGGESAVESAAASLLKLSRVIDTDRMGEPSFLMVLTAVGSFAYQRPDGVIVCPVSVLGP